MKQLFSLCIVLTYSPLFILGQNQPPLDFNWAEFLPPLHQYWQLYPPACYDKDALKKNKIRYSTIKRQICSNQAQLDKYAPANLSDIDGGEILEYPAIAYVNGEKIISHPSTFPSIASGHHKKTPYWGYNKEGQLIYYSSKERPFTETWRDSLNGYEGGTYYFYNEQGQLTSKKVEFYKDEKKGILGIWGSQSDYFYNSIGGLIRVIHHNYSNSKGMQIKSYSHFSFNEETGKLTEEQTVSPAGIYPDDSSSYHKERFCYYNKELHKIEQQYGSATIHSYFTKKGQLLKRVKEVPAQKNDIGNYKIVITYNYSKEGRLVSRIEKHIMGTIGWENIKPEIKNMRNRELHTQYYYNKGGLLVRDITNVITASDSECCRFRINTYYHYAKSNKW